MGVIFFWGFGGFFRIYCLIMIFRLTILWRMSVKALSHRAIPFMALLLFAVAFCGHADAALQLGMEDSAVSCVPIADPPASDNEVEQSSGDYGIAVFDAGSSSSPSQCIAAQPSIPADDEGTLVRRPESKINSIYSLDPLDQVPRL